MRNAPAAPISPPDHPLNQGRHQPPVPTGHQAPILLMQHGDLIQSPVNCDVIGIARLAVQSINVLGDKRLSDSQ